MKKISVIIPIYNTAKYLEKCVWSVCNQTYTNLEIICIDDGSTDNSGYIVDKFAENDNRIQVKHQKNHGISYSRNVGLKRATGDYIAFVDSDDWLEPSMYEILVALLEKENVDFVAGSWFRETDSSTIIKNEKAIKSGCFGKMQLLKYIYERDSYRGFAYIWNKLYKRKIFYDKYGKLILFDETLKIGEDAFFLGQLALNVERVTYMDKAVYHYRQHDNSSCHSVHLEKQLDWLRAYEMLIDLFQTHHIDDSILNLVKRFLAYLSSNVAYLAYQQKEKDYLLICQHLMKKYEPEYIKLNKNKPEYIHRFNKILAYKLC